MSRISVVLFQSHSLYSGLQANNIHNIEGKYRMAKECELPCLPCLYQVLIKLTWRDIFLLNVLPYDAVREHGRAWLHRLKSHFAFFVWK